MYYSIALFIIIIIIIILLVIFISKKNKRLFWFDSANDSRKKGGETEHVLFLTNISSVLPDSSSRLNIFNAHITEQGNDELSDWSLEQFQLS